MKMFTKCLAIIFVLGAALFVSAPSADAADTGAENVIPMIEWKCAFPCQAEWLTFDPEDIAAGTSENHKLASYQQKNWLIFDKNTPIDKCKSPDGAHYFIKRNTRNMSPAEIAFFRHFIIVLNERSQNMKARVTQWQCDMCGRKGFCFYGDDMDMGPPIDPRRKSDVFNMKSKDRIPDCKWLGFSGAVYPYHPLYITSNVGNPKPIELSKATGNLWWSN